MKAILGKRRKPPLKVIITFLFVYAGPLIAGQAVVDWQDERQIIDGGVGVAFSNAINLFYNQPDPVRRFVLDSAFSRVNGLGLRNIRVQPGGGGGHLFTARTIQPEPGVWDIDGQYDLVYLLREIQSRGVDVILTSMWTAPYFMKDNKKHLGAGQVLPEYFPDFADYLVRYFEEYRKRGIDYHTYGLQNEPGAGLSMDWKDDNIENFVHGHLIPKFAENKINADILTVWTWTDEPHVNYWDIFGSHYSDGGNGGTPNDEGPDAEYRGKNRSSIAFQHGKTHWCDECSRVREVDPVIPAWRIHHCFANLNITGYISWDLFMGSFIHDDDTEVALMRHGIYGLGHFGRWVRPGYRRIGCTDRPTENVRLSAYKDSVDGTLVFVAINLGETSSEFNIEVENAALEGDVQAWRSGASEGMVPLTGIQVTDNSFAAQLPPRSVTTYVAQGPQGSYQGIPTPKDVEIERLDSRLRLHWRGIPGADGYQIRLGESISQVYEKTVTVNGEATEYTIENLQNEKTYFIELRTMLGSEMSEPAPELIGAPRSPNLLEQATASVSSSLQGSAALLNDGSFRTSWKADATTAQWISFDLGTPKEINRIGIFWHTEGKREYSYSNAHAQKYEIQVSSDPTFSTAQTVASCTGHAGYEERDGLSAIGRYIRIKLLQSASTLNDRCFAIREVYAYSGPKPNIPIRVSEVSTSNESANKLKITWRPIEGVDGYNIYRWDNTTNFGYPNASKYRASVRASFASDPIDAGNTTEFILDGVSAGIEYGIMVTGYRNKGTLEYREGILSRPIFASPSGAPKAPRLLKAESGSGSVKLTWSPVPSVTGYRVYLTDNHKIRDPLLSTSDTTVLVDGLSNGKIYFCYVAAYNSEGESELSGHLEAHPLEAPVDTPRVNYGTVSNEIVLSWESIPGAAGYRIYYGANGPDSVIEIKDPSTTTITASVGGLENGESYHCIVAPYNLNAEGPRSKDTTITVIATPEVLVDNSDENVFLIGPWQTKTSGAHIGDDYLTDNGSGMEDIDVYAFYKPDIPEPGYYRIYMFYNTDGPERATNVNVRFNSSLVAVVDQNEQAGEWRYVTTRYFKGGTQDSVDIFNPKADGHVIADAFLFKRIHGSVAVHDNMMEGPATLNTKQPPQMAWQPTQGGFLYANNGHGHIKIDVFDLLGKRLTVLYDGVIRANERKYLKPLRVAGGRVITIRMTVNGKELPAMKMISVR